MNPVPRIFQILDKKGITAYKMAKDIGMSTARLSNWKQGKSTPSAEAIAQIADYLGVSTDYLLGRTDDPKGVAEVQILGYVDSDNKAHAFEDLTGEELQKLIEYADMMRKARDK